jgi:diaminopimelate epimerase
MKFFKYHGTGNDFIILDGMETGPLLSARDVENLCRRHTGIGADGVIYAFGASSGTDAAMRIFNADGSEAEMCGNGIRCLAKFLYERKGKRTDNMLVETGAGVKALRLFVYGEEVRRVEVDMGLPELISADLPAADDPSKPGIVNIDIGNGETVSALCVSMGNPHCVLFVDDVENAPVGSLGPLLERHPLFPNRTNVEFVQVADAHHIHLRVWERGVGETKACGSGTCAAAVASLQAGKAESPIEVSLPGGVLDIKVDDHGHVLMTGPAVEVYSGELNPSWRG